MRKLIIVAISLAASTSGFVESGAFAQEQSKPIVEIKTLDCRTFLKLDGDQRKHVIMFYHGYISGQRNETVADVDKLAQATDKVMDYCIDKPSDTLIKAFASSR